MGASDIELSASLPDPAPVEVLPLVPTFASVFTPVFAAVVVASAIFRPISGICRADRGSIGQDVQRIKFA